MNSLTRVKFPGRTRSSSGWRKTKLSSDGQHQTPPLRAEVLDPRPINGVAIQKYVQADH